MRLAVALICAALVTAVTAAGGKSQELTTDEQTLRAAGLGTDDSALLQFFEDRARPTADEDKLLDLARKLGDASAEVRAKTAAQFIARGAAAVPALRYICNDLNDPVAAEHAQQCLEWLEGARRGEAPIAAARLLAVRKPHGAAAALLTFLPFAEDATVFDGIKAALISLACSENKAEPALVKALQDPLPLRRAIAVEVLCGVGQSDVMPQVRKLLADPKPLVRLRAALALAERQEEKAVGVLIDLLSELPPAQRRTAEEALQQLAGDWAPNPALTGDDEVSRKIRRDSWAAWWTNTDGDALMGAFRKRTLTSSEYAAVMALIDGLGAKTFAARERAALDLVALGPKVVPLLREATQNPDLERAQRAKNCLKQIGETEDKSKLPAAAARLLSIRNPPGATEVLLAFIPFTDDEVLKAETSKALKHLALAAGKPEPVLVKALTDSFAQRRAAAAEALAGVGATEHFPAIRKLLQDSEPAVRLRAAIALTYAHDKEAVPALIDIIAEAPRGQAWEGEELLYRLAGASAPPVSTGNDAATRKRFRDDWTVWWKDHNAEMDLSQLQVAPPLMGYTLVVEFSQIGNNGRVVELDRNGKPRWQIENLSGPVDAWFLPGNRVLIAEGNANRVTERDLKGNILWQANSLAPGGYPVNAQRLANGNTFIACANNGLLVEVDRAGKTVFSVNVTGGVRAAYKIPNGQMICFTDQSMCVRLDTTGKEIKRFPLARINNFTSGIDVTSKGNIIAAQGDNTITEYDPEGKVVWQAKTNANTSATRLPNGHTLVASNPAQSVVELDNSGRVVWEYRAPAGHFPFRARQR
jgi:HEAT repeat protein